MKGTRIVLWTVIAVCVSVVVLAGTGCRAQTQPNVSAAQAQTGAIEFVARVTPTDGRPEPAREMPFYLLRKSFADIRKEAEEIEPRPDLDQFIDGLEVSPELKAWMKKKRSVELAGSEFIRRIKVDDIMDVPEFYDAYMRRNSGDVAVGFPVPKFRRVDEKKEPEKYNMQKDEFHRLMRKYIEVNPQSIDGIEVYLDPINPGQRWARQESEMKQRARKRALETAQTHYLASKTETDLEGRGSFGGLAPGEYWLGTLETEAVAGDARLRWDAKVTVRAGATARAELSNLNAVERARPAK